MGKPTAHRLSAMAVINASKTLRKATNQTWNLAPKAPMFTRKSKSVAGKKKVVRTKRLIGGHAYKIVASGAAGYAQAVLKREAAAFRQTIGEESKRVPWLPSIGKGAIAVLEQFLCAYAQEATRHAVSVRVGLGHTDKKSGEFKPLFTRLNGKLMKMGYDQADAQVFATTMPAPRTLMVCKPLKKVVAKKGESKSNDAEDGDYQAPEAD
jgi:hypothetical protein